uniref:Synaptopodin n=1 Tax=Seriola lalandi dorsalis TaxID=1841481 RepID=A0A3B4XDU8_SERLL
TLQQKHLTVGSDGDGEGTYVCQERGELESRRNQKTSPGNARHAYSWDRVQCIMGEDRIQQRTDEPENKLSSLSLSLSLSLSISLTPDLTRSASLSEKELKEARVRSQIIAAQLTIPSNSSSRGVQLFNRRKQRVNAFTLESCGEGSEEDRAENVRTDPSSKKLTWAERSSEEKDRNLNLKNSSTKPLFSPPLPVRVPAVGDIMEDPGKDFHKEEDMEDSVIQERHFLPVKEEQEEEEEARDKIHEDKVKDEISAGSDSTDPVVMGHVEGEVEINGGHTGPAPQGLLLNGCHSASGPERASVSTSKQASAIINRTARPFFSPPTVQSPDAVSPVMDIPPPPSYTTPPLPAFTAPQPVAFSPPPPPPSYPTPPLPAFTNQPPQAYYSSPPPMSPVMLPSSPPPSQFPASSGSHYPSMPHYGPPTAPKPSTFVPQPSGERKPITQTKTGILEEGAAAARRASRKSMFTFKEKPVVAPNPELLSLVQGVDERKKHGHRSVPEPTSEEELLALGAEASNFLAEEENRAEEAKAPEWASCLKSSRTRPRSEHRPEQTLSNVSGRGAELFAKRQSRMEKYVVENQSAGQMRSPSPTMSLPPSWVYPSNMPGRVKAIQKPRQKPPAPQPVPEPTPLENGCSKIEMDLSRHRPYQLSSSLFTFNPVKDPMSTLPRGAPQAKNLISTQTFPRQTSLPNNSPSHFSAQRMSPQVPLSPTGGAEYLSNPASGQPRISSPMGTRCQSPMANQNIQFSNVTSTTTSRPFQTSTFTSPRSPPWGSRCQSPMVSQNTSTVVSTSTSRPSQTNHRLLAKNIINAAKRKNSPSPGALSGHSLPISPLGNSGYDCHKPPISPFQLRALGAQSPTFTSPPPTPTQRICSPARLYNTRSLTDSDASVESEDSGLRSPGLHSYNTCPRGWGGSLRVKRSTVSTDL